MKITYWLAATLSLIIVAGCAWLIIDHQAQQTSVETSELVVEEVFMSTSIRPRPRPSDVIVIGNHRVFTHESLHCGTNSACDLTPYAEADDQAIMDLSPTELEQQRDAISAALREAIAQP
jgi:hypothetical protein